MLTSHIILYVYGILFFLKIYIFTSKAYFPSQNMNFINLDFIQKFGVSHSPLLLEIVSHNLTSLYMLNTYTIPNQHLTAHANINHVNKMQNESVFGLSFPYQNEGISTN